MNLPSGRDPKIDFHSELPPDLAIASASTEGSFTDETKAAYFVGNLITTSPRDARRASPDAYKGAIGMNNGGSLRLRANVGRSYQCRNAYREGRMIL